MRRVSAGLNTAQRAFRSWYKAHKFDYAADMTFSSYGMTAELTERLTAPKDGWDTSTDKSGKNIYLLDTDNNRNRMEALFRDCFPQSRILGYDARRNIYESDGEDQYLLRTKVFVDFSELMRLEGGEEEDDV